MLKKEKIYREANEINDPLQPFIISFWKISSELLLRHKHDKGKKNMIKDFFPSFLFSVKINCGKSAMRNIVELN
jgi:hypothetical protein